MTKILLEAICMASEAAEPASEAIKKMWKVYHDVYQTKGFKG